MIATEELRPAYDSAVADLRDVPLGDLVLLPPDLLRASLGRVLPDPVATPYPVAAFQSSI